MGLGSGVRNEKSLFSEPGGLRGPAADSEGVEGRFSARRPVLSGFRCAGRGGGHEMPPGLVPSLSCCTPWVMTKARESPRSGARCLAREGKAPVIEDALFLAFFPSPGV